MLHFLLSWLRPLGLLPGGFQYFYLRDVQFSLPVVLVGVLWWWQVMSRHWLCIYICVYIFVC